MTVRRRAALLVTGTACLLGALVPAVQVSAAEQEKGEGLGSYGLAANAPVVQVRFDDGNRCAGQPSSTGGCEGVVPETVSTLSKGPIGYALSSIVWPGTLGGNLGSTIILAGNGQVPQDATQLNSPVRAEARTGQGDAKTTYDDVPGTTMTASATDDEVTASADVAQSQALGVGTFGNSTSRTRTAVTGVATAVGEAFSEVTDVELAGVVKIGAVRSTAKATTDGAVAKAEGGTVASGITIAGVPVTIDDKGIRVAGQGGPFNETLSDTVNAAVAQAGLTVAVSRPVTTSERGNVQYSAGSLVFDFQPSEEAHFTVVLGGATVSLAAEPGFDLDGVDLPVAPVPAFEAPPATGGTADLPVGDAPAPVALDGGAAPAPDVAAPAEGAVALPELAERRLELPDGIPPATLVLGLLGAGLLAGAFKRLPDRLLETAPTTRCTLGGER